MWQRRTLCRGDVGSKSRHRPWGLTRHESRFHQKYPDREGRDMENGPEGCERGQIGNRAGRNHNRSRTALGQESLVYIEAIAGPCVFNGLRSYPRSRVTTASPASAVLATAPPAAISAVRTPAEMLAATAFSMAAASSCSSSE